MPAPKTRRVAGVLATLGCVVLSGCQQAPTAPARSQAQTTHIGGQVTDALLRGLSEALVEVLDGPDAGKRFVADADGRFAATSTARANSSVTLRASKDGYQSTTVATTWVPLDTLAHVLVRMPGFEPYDALGSGEYTITIAIDLESARSRLPAGPCPGYPVELSSRTYNARVTEGPAGRREVNATSPTVARESGFSMFVEGDRAVIDGDNDGIREDFPGFRVLTVWVGALPTDPRQLTSGASTSIPVTGEFRYCELKSALGVWYDCSQVPGNQILAYHSCTSDRVLMTFTKR